MRIVAGTFRGRVLKTVEGPGYRPAMARVREALFSMLEARGLVWSVSTALDLFAGSGSLAFEALSRGAQSALLVEQSTQAVRSLQQNVDMLHLDAGQCRIVQDDVAKVLCKRPVKPFEVVFIDPPYGKDLLSPTIKNLLRYGWVGEGSFVTAEVEAKLAYDPEKTHENLELLTERTFGQTRILIWNVIKK